MKDYASVQSAFEQDGFVHIPAFMNAEEMDEVESHVLQFIRDVVPKLSKVEAMFEDNSKPETLKQIGVGMNLHDPFFAEFLLNPRFINLAEAVLGDKVVPQHVQYFSKPPGIGRATPSHQDGFYFCLVPNEAVSFWIPLDEIDQQNGALRYWKGSHKLGLLPHGASHVLGFSQGMQEGSKVDLGEEVVWRVKRGDCLFHHSLMVHAADGNPSSRLRRAVGSVYYAERAKVDPEASRAYTESALSQWKAKSLA
jgi:phytanoyl-CoA hydroxylase